MKTKEKDYYALQAFFAPVVDRDDLPLASPAARQRYRRQLAAWEDARLLFPILRAGDYVLEAEDASIGANDGLYRGMYAADGFTF